MRSSRPTTRTLLILTTTLVTSLKAGTWMLKDEEKPPKLTQNEVLKINLNNSLSSFSRFEILQNYEDTQVNTVFGFDEKNQKFDFSDTPLDFPKKCYGFTQVSSFGYAYLCEKIDKNDFENNPSYKDIKKIKNFGFKEKIENFKEKYFVYFNTKNDKVYKISDITGEEIDGYDCSKIIESYSEIRNLVLCTSEEKKKMKFLYITFDENNQSSSKNDKIEKKIIEEFPETFNFKKFQVTPTLIFAKFNNIIAINVISINFDYQNPDNYNFFMLTIISSEHTKFFQFYKTYNMTLINNFSGNENEKYVSKVDTDGERLFFLILEKGKYEDTEQEFFNAKILCLRYQYLILYFTKIFYSDPLFSFSTLEFYETKEISIPNLSLGVTNIIENGTVYNPEKITKIALYHYMKSVTFVKISTENGKILNTWSINGHRMKVILDQIMIVFKLRVVDNTVLIYGVSTDGYHKIALWHVEITDDLDTYDFTHFYPLKEKYGNFILSEDLCEEFFTNEEIDGKTFKNKRFLFLIPNGKIVKGNYYPPSVNFKFNNFKYSEKKTGLKSEMNSYNEVDRRWKQFQFSVDLVKKGGFLQLENNYSFHLDIYKKGLFSVHLPDIVQGNGVDINVSLRPDIEEIYPKKLKQGFFNIEGINMFKVDFLKFYLSNYILVKYKDAVKNEYNMFKCTKKLLEQGLDCKELVKFALEEQEKITELLEVRGINSVHIILKKSDYLFKKIIVDLVENGYPRSYQLIEDIEILDGGFNHDNIYYFLGVKKSTKNVKKVCLFYLDYSRFGESFSPKTIELPSTTPGGFPIDLKRILTVSYTEKLTTFYDSKIMIAVLAPSLMILSYDPSVKKSLKFVYVNHFTYNLNEGSYMISVLKDKWITFVDFNLDLEFNMKTIRIKPNNDDGGGIERIGYYEILTNFNRNFFNSDFREIFEVKSFCVYETCYGFFQGVTHNSEFKLIILDLDYFKNSSNRVRGTINLEKRIKIINIEFDCDYSLFQIHSFSENQDHRIYYLILRKTPFLMFNLTTIEDISSRGNVYISANYTNIVGDEINYVDRNVMKIHENEMSFKYSLPTDLVYLDPKKKNNLINLDKVLNLQDWVYDVELSKENQENIYVMKRFEEVDYTQNKEIKNLGLCLNKYNFPITLGPIRITYHSENLLMTAIRQYAKSTYLRLLITRLDEDTNNCSTQDFPLDFVYADSSHYTKDKETNFLFLSFREMKYHKNSVLVVTHVYFDKSLKKYISNYERYRINEDSYRTSCVKITPFLEEKMVYLVSLCKKLGLRDSLQMAYFKVIGERTVNFEIFSGFDLLDDDVSSMISSVKIATFENFFVAFIQQKFKNYLIIALFEFLVEEEKINFIKSEKYFLKSGVKNEKGEDIFLSELGLWASKITLDREIKNMKTRLVLATKSFSSFLIEVKFENFLKVKFDSKWPILQKNGLNIIRKLQNNNYENIIKKVDLVDDLVMITEAEEYHLEDTIRKGVLSIYNITEKIENPNQEKTLKKKLNHEVELVKPSIMKRYKNQHFFSSLKKNGEFYYVHTFESLYSESLLKQYNSSLYQINENFKIMVKNPQKVDLKEEKLILKNLRKSCQKQIEIPLNEIFKKRKTNYSIVICIFLILITTFLIIILKIKEKNKMKLLEFEKNKMLSDSILENNTLQLDKSLNSKFEGISILENTQSITNKESGINLIDQIFDMTND